MDAQIVAPLSRARASLVDPNDELDRFHEGFSQAGPDFRSNTA